MPGESYRMSNKQLAENVNDVYKDNKIKFKKRNFAIICVAILVVFTGSILATYFGHTVTCPIEESMCESYFCRNPQLHDGF